MICIHCGEITTNPKFCSSSCAAKVNNKIPKRKRSWVPKMCIQCNKEMRALKKKHSKFCSQECRSQHTIYRIQHGLADFGITKRYVFKTRENKCEVCGLGAIWNGKRLSLQVDHIDGNSDNNNLDNLRIICPNCHTQTDTWCERNHKNTKRNSYLGRYKRKVLYASLVE